MLRLALPPEMERPPKLLCLGAHPDDIEIGCGGTILHLAAAVADLAIRWVVFSGNDQRATEARNSAADFLRGIPDKRVDVLSFRDGYFPYHGADIKDRFEALKQDLEPLLILTHRKDDAHQDHRLVGELTHNTFRNHFILEYEIPKYDGDLAGPNFFVPLTRMQVNRKIEAISKHFLSSSGVGGSRRIRSGRWHGSVGRLQRAGGGGRGFLRE